MTILPLTLPTWFETRPFINGEFRASVEGQTFASINPATGQELAQIHSGGQGDVDLAVAAARAAFGRGVWSRRSPRDRKKVLLHFADLIERHIDELALIETLDCGKPLSDSRAVDLPDSIETLRWHAEAADKIYDQMSPAPADVVSMIVREPIGVVGAVLPWNFPLFVAMWKIAPALATGNSIVIKPAELTSLSILRLASLAAEAGIPEGVFNVVPGLGAKAGRALGLHQDVDCISFTGSGEVGRYFLKYAADSNLKRIILECGGKSPAIVLDDVTDFAPVVEQVANGFLFCQGENCSAGTRLIVSERIREPLVEELKRAVGNWTVGDPLDASTKIGALIEKPHMERVLSYIEKGKSEGAELTLGGKQVLQESGGYFVEPTIFEAVSNDMSIAREEIFGPVLSVISVRDDAEAVRIANDTNFGLAASLYTNDLSRAHQVARSIRAGTVSVNCYSEGDFAVPFGGYKESGFGGKDKGFAAHDQYCEIKAIWMQLR